MQTVTNCLQTSRCEVPGARAWAGHSLHPRLGDLVWGERLGNNHTPLNPFGSSATALETLAGLVYCSKTNG